MLAGWFPDSSPKAGDAQPVTRLAGHFGKSHLKGSFPASRIISNYNFYYFPVSTTHPYCTSLTFIPPSPSLQYFHSVKWINGEGLNGAWDPMDWDSCSSQKVSGDIGFFSQKFFDALRYFGIKFEPRPARPQKNLGVVQQKNAILRTLVQRLLNDASHFSTTLSRSAIQSYITE